MEYVRRLTCSNFLVGGSVVRGYEPVRRIFEDYFLSRQESRAQLCVYVDQQKVVGKMVKVYIIYDDDDATICLEISKHAMATAFT